MSERGPLWLGLEVGGVILLNVGFIWLVHDYAKTLGAWHYYQIMQPDPVDPNAGNIQMGQQGGYGGGQRGYGGGQRGYQNQNRTVNYYIET